MNEPLRVVAQPTASPPVTEPGMDFEGLVEAEHGPLYGALCLITRDRAEAEDVMQEAFLKVWERWDHVREMANPTGYLYRTAMNLYRKRLRRASFVLRRSVRLTPPHDELGEVEARDAVVRALAALTPRQRMSVVLVDLLDYSSEEAAQLMRVRPSTVRVLVSQGRAALKRKAGDEE